MKTTKRKTKLRRTMYVWPNIGDTIVIKKAPASLKFLKGCEAKVRKKNKADYTMIVVKGGLLVVDFGSIRKKIFAFKVKKVVELPARS